MNSIVVVGSMAFDSIETPFGKAPKILGGSANYFSLSASHFTKVNVVSVVGQDFPKEHLETLRQKGIDTEGLRQEHGQTFHWAGSYGFDLHEAKTLATELNVFERFEPTVPASYTASPFLFLGNIAPALQIGVHRQMKSPRFIALDTMNFWISGQKEPLLEAISLAQCLIINEGELRQLTGMHNVVLAARQVRAWGPRILVVKRGEYGALLFDGDEVFSLPGLPLAEVKDPTGAGDTFAGGFMGYLASLKQTDFSGSVLRKAIVYGCVMASFVVQDFGFKELLKLTEEKIQERYSRFIHLTTFHER